MAYFDPRMVISPKTSIEEGSVNVVHDRGEWRGGDGWSGWSVAELTWEGEPAVGIRWNVGENSVGNPQSRGVPTWFISPSAIAHLVLNQAQTRKAD